MEERVNLPYGALNREKGNKAEDLACEFLRWKGYEIVKRNFHFGKLGEIDIVAEIDDELVFAEVRSRYSADNIDPMISLNRKKQMALRKAAEGYIYVNKIENRVCRMDFITIDMFTKPPTVTHVKNAF